MKYLFILSIFNLLIFHTEAQEKKVGNKNITSKFIRFNITGLLDPVETNFSTGFELGFQKKWAAALDVGYIFYTSYYENTNSTNGIIIRPAIRYYTDQVNRAFLELELHYKNVHNNLTDWLDKDLVNNVPSFSQYQDFTVEKVSFGAHLKMGYKARLSKNEKFWFESYLGLGIRGKKEAIINEPNSSFNFTNFIRWGPLEDNKVFVTIPFGFRVLYRL